MKGPSPQTRRLSAQRKARSRDWNMPRERASWQSFPRRAAGRKGTAERWGAWVSPASCAQHCRQSHCWTFRTHQKPSHCLSGSVTLVSCRQTTLASLQMIQQQPAGTLHSCRQLGSFPWAKLSNVLPRWPVIREGSPQASSPGDLARAPPWPPRCPPPRPTRLSPPPSDLVALTTWASCSLSLKHSSLFQDHRLMPSFQRSLLRDHPTQSTPSPSPHSLPFPSGHFSTPVTLLTASLLLWNTGPGREGPCSPPYPQ